MVSVSSMAACMLWVSRDVAFCSAAAAAAKCLPLEEAVVARGTGNR